MRVIAGEKRGTYLVKLKGEEIRPTSDKIKEAIFSSLQFELMGAKIFVDLFAGSGAMGIEALSRGVEKSYFFDISNTSLNIIKENLKKTAYENRSIVLHKTAKDAIDYLSQKNIKCDFIFMDPPYSQGESLIKLLNYLEKKEILENHGKIVIETEKSVIIFIEKSRLHCYKKKKYGNTLVRFYGKE